MPVASVEETEKKSEGIVRPKDMIATASNENEKGKIILMLSNKLKYGIKIKVMSLFLELIKVTAVATRLRFQTLKMLM